jgi:hypothetical protein
MIKRIGPISAALGSLAVLILIMAVDDYTGAGHHFLGDQAVQNVGILGCLVTLGFVGRAIAAGDYVLGIGDLVAGGLIAWVVFGRGWFPGTPFFLLAILAIHLPLKAAALASWQKRQADIAEAYRRYEETQKDLARRWEEIAVQWYDLTREQQIRVRASQWWFAVDTWRKQQGYGPLPLKRKAPYRPYRPAGARTSAQSEAEPEKPSFADLAALKAKMMRAHPDQGGPGGAEFRRAYAQWKAACAAAAA